MYIVETWNFKVGFQSCGLKLDISLQLWNLYNSKVCFGKLRHKTYTVSVGFKELWNLKIDFRKLWPTIRNWFRKILKL